uniref:L1 transposable element RRM domain-containing protein n=1 Tax=Latimeria chalumnae TaxID=7897 RepID=H2ZUV6_LATCH
MGKKSTRKSAPGSPTSGSSEEVPSSLSSSPRAGPSSSAEINLKTIQTLILQLTSDVAEVKLGIQNLQASQDFLGTRIVEAERWISKIKDSAEEETQRLLQMEQKLTTAVQRIEDLENRSRRNNVKIVGFPEGVEGGNPIKFLQSVLPELLDLKHDLPLQIERARHTLGPRPTPGQRPRAFVIKLLCFPTRELLLKAARDKGQLKWKQHRVYLFPDWSRDLQAKRQRFWEVRKLLREKGVRYGLFYPAILKITYWGETQSFTDPDEVKKFLTQNVGLVGDPRNSESQSPPTVGS